MGLGRFKGLTWCARETRKEGGKERKREREREGGREVKNKCVLNVR